VNEDDLYREIEEEVRKRSKEVKEAPEKTSEVPREISRSDPRLQMDAWRGAWLLIFTFFLAVTLAMTGLSLLFGEPSPFGTYWFMWVILAFLVIIYPVAQLVDRWTGGRR
jgi:hypothetical protein